MSRSGASRCHASGTGDGGEPTSVSNENRVGRKGRPRSLAGRLPAQLLVEPPRTVIGLEDAQPEVGYLACKGLRTVFEDGIVQSLSQTGAPRVQGRTEVQQLATPHCRKAVDFSVLAADVRTNLGIGDFVQPAAPHRFAWERMNLLREDVAKPCNCAALLNLQEGVEVTNGKGSNNHVPSVAWQGTPGKRATTIESRKPRVDVRSDM